MKKPDDVRRPSRSGSAGTAGPVASRTHQLILVDVEDRQRDQARADGCASRRATPLNGVGAASQDGARVQIDQVRESSRRLDLTSAASPVGKSCPNCREPAVASRDVLLVCIRASQRKRQEEAWRNRITRRFGSAKATSSRAPGQTPKVSPCRYRLRSGAMYSSAGMSTHRLRVVSLEHVGRFPGFVDRTVLDPFVGNRPRLQTHECRCRQPLVPSPSL